MNFFNGFYVFENTLFEKKKLRPVIVQLVDQLPGKFLCVIWNLITKTYPKFVRLRSFFLIFKEIFKNVKRN